MATFEMVEPVKNPIAHKVPFAALISGGKDSMLALMEMIASGHSLKCIINIEPEGGEEVDSYMYQSIGHGAIPLIADQLNVPLIRRTVKRYAAIERSEFYYATEGDEVEEMFMAMKYAKEKYEIRAVCSGAVLSNYQRTRVENCCGRLELTSFAPLWQRAEMKLLIALDHAQVVAIIIKCCSYMIGDNIIGKEIISHEAARILEFAKQCLPDLSLIGEGGEYESLTLQCPLFKERIGLGPNRIEDLGNDTHCLMIDSYELEDKIPSDRGTGVPSYYTPDVYFDELQVKMRQLKVDKCFTEDPMEKFALTAKVCSETPNYPATPPDDALIVAKSHIGCSVTEDDDGMSQFVVIGRGDETQLVYVRALEKLAGMLVEDYSLASDNVCMIRVYITDCEMYKEFNAEYERLLEWPWPGKPPARVVVGTALPPGVKVIMQAIASTEPSKLWVRSISHWAPANIGPYSQAAKTKTGMVYVAGQIPLIPSTMDLPEPNSIKFSTILGEKSVYSFLVKQHVQDVMSAFDEDARLIVGILYVADVEYLNSYNWLFDWLFKQEKKMWGIPIIVVGVKDLPRGAPIEFEAIGANIKCGNNVEDGNEPVMTSLSYMPMEYFEFAAVLRPSTANTTLLVFQGGRKLPASDVPPCPVCEYQAEGTALYSYEAWRSHVTQCLKKDHVCSVETCHSEDNHELLTNCPVDEELWELYSSKCDQLQPGNTEMVMKRRQFAMAREIASFFEDFLSVAQLNMMYECRLFYKTQSFTMDIAEQLQRETNIVLDRYQIESHMLVVPVPVKCLANEEDIFYGLVHIGV